MIAKVLLLCTVVAAANATGVLNSGILAPGLLNSAILSSGLYNPGIVAAPGLLNSGIVAPGLLNSGLAVKTVAPLTSSVATSSVVATPGAITTDKRVIGASGVLAGAPLVYSNGIVANGLVANGLVANGLVANGLYGAAPLALNSGIVSPIGLRSAGILAGPGLVKTILK